MQDKILVLMTIYNEPLSYIEQSLSSIKNQTYSNFSVNIVVDNPAVSNEIRLFLNTFCKQDNRFRVLFNEDNIGLALSLNKAFFEFKNEVFKYIARIDSDDICLLNRFDIQVDYLNENPDIDLIGSSAYQIDEAGDLLDDFFVSKGEVKLKFGSNSIHPTWMMKVNVFLELSGYRNYRCSQDYDFLCRAKLKGFNVENIEEKTIYYRLRLGSIGQKNRLQQRRIKFYISKSYRNSTTNDWDVPVHNHNIMCSVFNFVEKRRKSKKILSLFSYYHMKNLYFLFMKSREINGKF
ncbi:glycosyltransferase [Aliivibrio fischeri]|uniref:glycosyltransferase n=1 Tax=Aliivibrio fischeri TaxID=668 RepID=UPI0012DA519F|nr:glycosyltransferase [Aliivibrio fischeri]MUK65334.1 glycosyltransferase [Aliivibrio fischeri]